MHLLGQCVKTREPALVPQLGDEVHVQAATIQVAREVEHMHFERRLCRLPARLVQHRPGAEIGDPRSLLEPAARTPLAAVMFGVLVWGDRPGPRLLVGGALVLCGILVVTLRARRKLPRVSPA